MNRSFIFSILIRWFFFMPVLAVLIVAFIYLTGVTSIGLLIVYTIPVSLFLLSGVCLLCSLLVTIKNPVLFKNQFDKYAVALGNLVILIAGVTMLYSLFTKESGQRIPAETVTFVEKKLEYPKNVLDEWEQGIWRNKTPACLRTTESSIENACPGSIDVTFCWEMDPMKDWGTDAASCALGKKSTRIFSKGETQLKVPWCRSYDSACFATLKVIEAKALKFK